MSTMMQLMNLEQSFEKTIISLKNTFLSFLYPRDRKAFTIFLLNRPGVHSSSIILTTNLGTFSSRASAAKADPIFACMTDLEATTFSRTFFGTIPDLDLECVQSKSASKFILIQTPEGGSCFALITLLAQMAQQKTLR
ncbi:hypothetical protein V6Z11_A03G037400 [Gossypium hirsutum]